MGNVNSMLKTANGDLSKFKDVAFTQGLKKQ